MISSLPRGNKVPSCSHPHTFKDVASGNPTYMNLNSTPSNAFIVENSEEVKTLDISHLGINNYLHTIRRTPWSFTSMGSIYALLISFVGSKTTRPPIFRYLYVPKVILLWFFVSFKNIQMSSWMGLDSRVLLASFGPPGS